ncbi:MAG: hypothetical protein NTY01_20795 [Verrucomicrobia bacterium]|nr:hypothetical protein [Verrucomicrobiota bacterium]
MSSNLTLSAISFAILPTFAAWHKRLETGRQLWSSFALRELRAMLVFAAADDGDVETRTQL